MSTEHHHNSITENNNNNITDDGTSSISSSVMTRRGGRRVNMVKLLPREPQPHLLPLVKKTTRRMLTVACYAIVARLLLGLSKSLLKSGASVQKFIHLARRELLSKNPLKWAVLVAGLSSFRLWQQLVMQFAHVPKQWASFVGGVIASLPVMVMNLETRTELGLYLGVRAAHGMAMANWSLLPPLLRDFNHYDIITMSLTAAQILYSSLFEPSTLLPSYNDFLMKNTGFPKYACPSIAAVTRNIIVPEMELFSQQQFSLPVVVPPAGLSSGMKGCCSYSHPHTNSCMASLARFILKHFATFSLPLYLPIKTTTTLIFKWKTFARAPLTTAAKIIQSASTSACFLTLYTLSPVAMLCISANINLRSPAAMAIISGSVSGLTTFLEPKGRRLDLALYCSMHALRGAVLLLHLRGYLPKPTRRWVFLLHTVAMATIMHQFDSTPESLHPNLRGACGWLVGEKYRTPEEIRKALLLAKKLNKNNNIDNENYNNNNSNNNSINYRY